MKKLKNVLEIRSKKYKYQKVFEKIKPLANVIPAFSLNPEHVVKEFEDKTPSLKKIKSNYQTAKFRLVNWLEIRSINLLQQKGGYEEFLKRVFELIDKNKIHSITLGKFRCQIDI